MALEKIKLATEQTKFKKFKEKRAFSIGLNPLTIGVGSVLGGLGIHGLTSGLGTMMSPAADVVGYKAYKNLFPGLPGMMAQTQLPEETLKSFGMSAGKTLGMDTGETIGNAIKSIIDRNKEIIYDSPRRKEIFEVLRHEDDLIKNMPLKLALEAYHSMTKHAPTLSLDKNAVKSFLRTVATSPEGGIDWNTIKGLADAENSILKVKETAANL